MFDSDSPNLILLKSMKRVSTLAVFLLILQYSVAPPVDNKLAKEETSHPNEVDSTEYDLEYGVYIKQVVQALEDDPAFREKLENAPDHVIKSGKIADYLDLVNHHVRGKLDEIKRVEIERLRQLYKKKHELEELEANGVNMDHIDHSNPHTFEIEDLKKLILKATQDLAYIDKKTDQEFKEYELDKEFEKREKMKKMDKEEREKFEKQMQEEHEKMKKHKPLHHPGSKQQLEEVWKEEDQMTQQFNAKSFFLMHDVDGNGVWDPEEVEALFVKELDKVYNEKDSNANHDLVERNEQMKKMRQHVFNETDLNRDGLIDIVEFMIGTNSSDFQNDPAWNEVDNDNRFFSEQEYLQYEQDRLRAMNGLHPNVPPPPQYQQPNYQQQQAYHGQVDQYPPPQYHPQQVQFQQPPQPIQYQYNQVPAQHNQPPVQYNQAPVQHNQPPPVQYNQVPIQQNQPPVQYNQAPIQQNQPPVQYNQAPPVQQNQIPVQQNQVPVQQNQVPVQQNQAPIQQNQAPVQQPQQQQAQQINSAPHQVNDHVNSPNHRADDENSIPHGKV